MSEELADWEVEVIISPEEQAQIDALRRDYANEGERDALTTRLAALQADVDATKAQLAALNCTDDCGCESVCESVCEGTAPAVEESVAEAPVEEPVVEEPVVEPEPVVEGKSTDLNAAEAADAAADYTDAEALKAWAEGDDRKTVVTAVEKKLAELS
jgi:hypothetical protein